MDHEDPPSKSHRRHSSVGVVEKWGLVEAWLASGSGRMIILGSGPHGLRVTLMDPDRGEEIENVHRDEEPSAAILRAMSRFPITSP